MPDDKSSRGAQDRSRISADEPYEVYYFAGRHGIPKRKAEQIIREFGPSRQACDEAAAKLK